MRVRMESVVFLLTCGDWTGTDRGEHRPRNTWRGFEHPPGPRPARSFKGAAPRGGASRNYLEWRLDTKELFRVAVKCWIIYFVTPKIIRVTVWSCCDVRLCIDDKKLQVSYTQKVLFIILKRKSWTSLFQGEKEEQVVEFYACKGDKESV
jgi:hypothetical protein